MSHKDRRIAKGSTKNCATMLGKDDTQLERQRRGTHFALSDFSSNERRVFSRKQIEQKDGTLFRNGYLSRDAPPRNILQSADRLLAASHKLRARKAVVEAETDRELERGNVLVRLGLLAPQFFVKFSTGRTRPKLHKRRRMFPTSSA